MFRLQCAFSLFFCFFCGRKKSDLLIIFGIKYLFELNQRFDDIDATLTAYSHGPTITKKYSKKYISSNFYVRRVKKTLDY